MTDVIHEILTSLYQARSTKGSQLAIKASTSDFVITTERSPSTSPTAIVNLMKTIFTQNNLDGCSSHSGRRTAITNWARKITEAGGSLKDVQQLAGHSALSPLGDLNRIVRRHENNCCGVRP